MDSIKLLVKKVYIDSSISGLGITNCAYWFNAFTNCTEVSGFENLSGMTNATQMFSSCSSLETIYATSFSNAGLSGSLMSNGCTRLAGGADGFVPTNTGGASVCKIGTGGVLTDPSNDARTWLWGHFYASSVRQTCQWHVCSEKAAKPISMKSYQTARRCSLPHRRPRRTAPFASPGASAPSASTRP